MDLDLSLAETPDKVPNGLLSEPRRTARGTKNEEERQKGEKPYWGHQRVEEFGSGDRFPTADEGFRDLKYGTLLVGNLAP
jgi:hypothetical protein